MARRDGSFFRPAALLPTAKTEKGTAQGFGQYLFCFIAGNASRYTSAGASFGLP